MLVVVLPIGVTKNDVLTTGNIRHVPGPLIYFGGAQMVVAGGKFLEQIVSFI